MKKFSETAYKMSIFFLCRANIVAVINIIRLSLARNLSFLLSLSFNVYYQMLSSISFSDVHTGELLYSVRKKDEGDQSNDLTK